MREGEMKEMEVYEISLEALEKKAERKVVVVEVD